MRAKGVPWSDAVALTADVTVPIFAVKESIIIMVPFVNIVIIIIDGMTRMIIYHLHQKSNILEWWRSILISINIVVCTSLIVKSAPLKSPIRSQADNDADADADADDADYDPN